MLQCLASETLLRRCSYSVNDHISFFGSILYSLSPFYPLPHPNPPQVRHDEPSLLSALKARCGSIQRPGLHVVHVAAEMAPIAKVWVGEGGQGR